MGFESAFVGAYLDGKLPLHGGLLQGLLNGYLDLYYRLEPYIGRRTALVPEQTEEIATRSRELMDTHYNMPLSMFTSFLGATMKYSMGLWETGARSLDEAQEAMMDDVFVKADVQDGQTLLDIGCGFGSLATQALRRFPNARVYGLTLSQTQADYMRARQAEPGHPLNTDRFYLIQGDFNNVHFDQPFDRVVSLGVFEHISNLARALEKIRTFISDNGVLFLHYIVYQPWPGQADAARQDPFIDRYIFPGGRIWAHTELVKHPQHFRLERSWFLSGDNYKRTLQAWLANYRANLERIRSESGLSDRQLRLWEFYLRACIGTFNACGSRVFGNGQYRLTPH